MSLASNLDELKAVSKKRQQITEEIEDKFYLLGKKRWVYIDNNDDLTQLSEYLTFDLLEYYQDYYGSIFNVTPIIIKCDFRLSLGGRLKHNQMDSLQTMMGGGSFEDDQKRAVSLGAFLNPNDHIEEFI